MVGHATMLIQVAGLNILTDPVWSTRVSPVSFAGPARVTAPGIDFDALPPLDAVLVTHNHYDHLDTKTLARLHAAHGMAIVTPHGNDTIIRDAVPQADLRPGDWGDVIEVGGRPHRPHPLPPLVGARHAGPVGWRCGRAFEIATPAGRIFHVGDTGYRRRPPLPGPGRRPASRDPAHRRLCARAGS